MTNQMFFIKCVDVFTDVIKDMESLLESLASYDKFIGEIEDIDHVDLPQEQQDEIEYLTTRSIELAEELSKYI